MIASKGIKILLLIAFLTFSVFARAQEPQPYIDELGADDLPTESVVPSVDSEVVVKNRLVSFNKRFEFGLAAGLVMDEMFFDNKFFSVTALYHPSEDTAWGLHYLGRQSGQSDYAKLFKQTSLNVDLSKAPAPSAVTALAYRYSFLYGKVSLARDWVLPMTLEAQGDLGMHKVGSQNLPYSAVGLSQKFYFQKRWGLGLNYKIMIYQTIDPVSAYLGGNAQPNESDFSKKIQMNQSFSLDLSYLF